MNWIAILSVACIISLALPVVVIIYNRYYTHRALAALLLCYTLTLLDNLMGEGLLSVPAAFESNFRLVVNYLDIPLMLISLLFFCPNRSKQRFVHLMIILLLAYEAIITIMYGFNKTAIIYILGPSLVLLLLYSGYLFARQVKFTILRRNNQGRTVMLASILFSYACYSLIYYFHYIDETPYKKDVLFLYFLSTTVSSLLMAVGLQLMRKRLKELRSVIVTRKELAMFFGH